MTVTAGVLDRRAELGPVRDQGSRPTCLAFAVTSGHELVRPGSTLAPEFLVWGAMAAGRDVRRGLRAEDIRSTLEMHGQCAESVLPYVPQGNPTTAVTYGASTAVLTDAATRKVTDHVRLPPSVSAVKSALDAGRAAVLILRVFRSIGKLAAGYEVPIPAVGEDVLGVHALLPLGYDDNRAAVLVRNSWGPGWGDGGHAWLPFGYPPAHLLEFWHFGVA